MDLFRTDDGDEAALDLRGSSTAQTRGGASRLPEPIRECLQHGGLVLTGNARAARALSLAYAQMQQRNGLEAWPAPSIRDWAGWMAALWEESLLSGEDAPLLLSALQEHALWKQAATEHGDAALVVSMDGMAELAQSAYSRLSGYGAHGTRTQSWDYHGSRDAEAFRRWAASFDQRSKKRNWMSRSLLEAHIAKAVAAGVVDVPGEILLSGFDRVLPAQRLVLKAVEERGTKVAFAAVPTIESAATPTLVEAMDLSDELATCARWARQRLIAAPDCRIAVIAQDGAGMRGEIERTFRSVLLPASISIAAPPVPPPFEFSLGRLLASVPVVRSALFLLRWLDGNLLQSEVSWLLLSGFFAERQGELLPLAALDAAIRQSEATPPEIGLDWWLRHSAGHGSEAAAAIRKRLMAARRRALDKGIGTTADRGSLKRNREKSYSEWMEIALEALGIAGWPGPENEDSIQFQARKKWEQLTDSVAGLAFDGSRVTYAEFLGVLGHTASETIFAPQSTNAPVQIMGPMESAGQSFDAVWFLGVDDLHWPLKASAHPLIPLRVQRDAEMPHGSVEADWQLAKRVTERIATSSAECVFSYANRSADGVARPSPLLTAVFGSLPPVTRAKAFLKGFGLGPVSPRKSRIVEIVDHTEICWPVNETAGGADVLKMQAACPFKAFATRRLGARSLDDAERGLTAMERGNILHLALQKLWSPDNEPQLRLQTRDELINAQATGRLASIIEHHVSNALHDSQDANDAWTTAYVANEHQRLCGLINAWLEKEAGREPFLVEACEQRVGEIHVGDLKLNLRIDRIDRLPSGARLLLDYKSSKVSTSAWEGERPDEPQLPLYAAYGNVENVQGVLLAQIRAHQMMFVGHVADATAMLDSSLRSPSKLVMESYDAELSAHWAATLHSLAGDFVRGNATVTPKKYPKTCTYCPLPSLCRVAETIVPVTSLAVDDPEAAEGSDFDGL